MNILYVALSKTRFIPGDCGLGEKVQKGGMLADVD